MNSCILMAEIVQDPQLRFTPDQLALAEMRVQIEGLKAEDPPAILKAVGWGNLAQEIQQKYHEGDRVILEGRLTMNSVTTPEGFKEKRAELTIQRIHAIGDGVNITSSTSDSATDSARKDRVTDATPKSDRPRQSTTPTQPRAAEKIPAASGAATRPQFEDDFAAPPAKPQPSYSAPTSDTDVDDIPF